MRFGVAGAGLSGAVTARQLADSGHDVVIHETRNHIAGNCHSERDPQTGVMVHRYGPHIFHTSNERVWDYVTGHAEMVPFELRVNTTVAGRVYPLPVNLATINQVFETTMSPAAAERFIADIVHRNPNPTNFEEAALAAVGRKLYGLLFEGYTTKQWGQHPSLLPASVFRRLPLRFNYDSNYFTHRWQAIPRHGYTALVESILDHPSITIELGSPYPAGHDYDHTIWTGPIDRYFDGAHGPLSYRTLDFQTAYFTGDFQGCALMNYGDAHVPWTRITEHKHFAPWEPHGDSVLYVEHSRDAGPSDDPFYPIRLTADLATLDRYLHAARRTAHVTFLGRLGTYRYLDMDVTIAEALHAVDVILDAINHDHCIPSLTHTETTR